MTRTTLALWVAVGVLLGMLATGPPALAHTEQPGGPLTYCGHYWKEWTVALPNGWVRYSETYRSGQTDFSHSHNYDVRKSYNGSAYWTFVHWHWGRGCPNTHPV